MVATQIAPRGIFDPRVIGAMQKVPRHEFIPPEHADVAYQDTPVSIGLGQTISQPYIVALMTQCLKLQAGDCVLEVGTGSGYQAAILAEIVKEVYTIERIPEIAGRAERVLQNLGYRNIRVKIADGTIGWEGMEFDAIMVTAASPRVIDGLFHQLKDGGRLVMPLGDRLAQTLVLFTKKNQGVTREDICQCVFVPLVGKFAWKEN